LTLGELIAAVVCAVVLLIAFPSIPDREIIALALVAVVMVLSYFVRLSEDNRPVGSDDNEQRLETELIGMEESPIEAATGEAVSNDVNHQAAEREFWNNQLSAARWLNLVTGAGATAGVVGLIFVGLSLVVARQAADDGEVAAHAAAQQAAAAVTQTRAALTTQRPWVSASAMKVIRDSGAPKDGSTHFDFVFEVTFRNTGVAVARNGFAMAHAASGIKGELRSAWDRACKDADAQADGRRHISDRIHDRAGAD
jgi:hypothetical protein